LCMQARLHINRISPEEPAHDKPPQDPDLAPRAPEGGRGAAGTALALDKAVPSLIAGAPRQASAAEKAIPTFCAMCGPGPGCGIYAYVRDGRFVRVEGMKESPLNQGRICAKAHAAPQWVCSPQRLRHPLRRAGRRGEGKFERINWEQAVDLIAARLKEQKVRYGPETPAILSPAHRSYSDYLYRFLIAHGSLDYGHSGICAMQKTFSFAYTPGAAPMPDIPRSKLILIRGKQPVYSGSTRGNLKQILDARERGPRIISINPTMEPDVALSDRAAFGPEVGIQPAIRSWRGSHSDPIPTRREAKLQ